MHVSEENQKPPLSIYTVAMAELLEQRWQREIKRAIAKAKYYKKRSELDEWFRRKWYQSKGLFENNKVPPIEGD